MGVAAHIGTAAPRSYKARSSPSVCRRGRTCRAGMSRLSATAAHPACGRPSLQPAWRARTGRLRAMQRVALLLVPFILAACSTATVPDPAPPASRVSPTAVGLSSTVCPSLATVRAYVAAIQRFDGAAAAALFTPDGYIQTPDYFDSQALRRYVGSDRIAFLVSDVYLRERAITRDPQGCEAEVTWGQRDTLSNPGPSRNLGATATLRDGKIASVVYLLEQPR